MAKKFPINPAHPERNCWGCDKYCPADDMQCGNGSDRTQHPAEIFGEDWDTWGLDPVAPQGAAAANATCEPASTAGALRAQATLWSNPPDLQVLAHCQDLAACRKANSQMAPGVHLEKALHGEIAQSAQSAHDRRRTKA